MSVVPMPSPVVPIPVPEVPLDGAPATPPAAAETSEPLAKHFAALSKKEKMLFRQQEALKQEKAQLAADRARVAELEAKYGSKPATPREALARYGFDYQQATDFELNDNKPTAEFIAQQAQNEVQKLREEQQTREQRDAQQAVERAEQEKAAIVEEFRGEIKDFLVEKGDEYEYINFHDAFDVVYQTIEQHHEKTGKLLSIPEGANIVEKFLEERSEKMRTLKKFAKTRPEGEPPTPESGFNRQPVVPAQRRTLDNTVTTSTPTLIKNPRVEDERMARALAALDRR